MTQIHPGSIQARVGAVMHLIEVNIEQQDMAGLWNFVQLLQVYVRPYLASHPDLEKALTQLRAPQTLPDGEAFQNMMDRIATCLDVLHRENLYGYHQVPIGTSEALYEEVTT